MIKRWKNQIIDQSFGPRNQAACYIWCWYLLNEVLCVWIITWVERRSSVAIQLIIYYWALCFYANILQLKDTTNTARSASYVDIHLDIDSERRLLTKHYVKRDGICFPIMNFPYICSNIPAAHAYREISFSCSDIPTNIQWPCFRTVFNMRWEMSVDIGWIVDTFFFLYNQVFINILTF